jgi:hypothetical protein
MGGIMFSISASKSLLFSFVLVLALSVAGSSAFAQSSRYTRDSAGSLPSAQVVDVNDVVTHPNQYVGKEVENGPRLQSNCHVFVPLVLLVFLPF